MRKPSALPRSSILDRVGPHILALALMAVSACHRYVPVTAATVDPGANVAVALTDFGTANLGRLLGMGAGTIEGHLVTVSDSLLTMSVHVVRQRDGIETFWKGERVSIPRADIAEIRQRRFSRSKSAVAGVALIAAAVGAVEAFIGVGGGSQPPAGGGGGGPR
jgi:hypothetical protein